MNAEAKDIEQSVNPFAAPVKAADAASNAVSEAASAREVEPLGPGPRRWQVAATDTYAYVYGTFLTVPEARALRDWLNAALPAECDPLSQALNEGDGVYRP